MQDKKKKKGFPDLNKDGKVTFKDILIGRGVVKKAKGGSLKGGQKKLDANKDGKISGDDFAMLRGKKSKDRGMGLQDKQLPPGKMVKKMGGGMLDSSMGYQKGGSVMARGYKLTRSKPTKLY